MSSIFSTGGVHSTLAHDDIVNSQSKEDPTNMLENEASKIANAAAEALKESRKQARKIKSESRLDGKFGSVPKNEKLTRQVVFLQI